MPNALARATSPYLRQHADNPVDWREWSPETLALAIRENKPILLSIGYSACHWCHVMAHESFEDARIAKQMNDGFVCIKVDREERPDLDQIYQLCVQLMGRSGGWPLTVFLTPDTKPFFAGTYFPNVDKYGMPGFPRILEAVVDAYKNKRGELDAQAAELTEAISKVAATTEKIDRSAIDSDVIDLGAREMSKRFDDVNGGFGTRPKFPNTMALEVLLRRGLRDDEFGKKCRERVTLALESMRNGGIYDQLGGGFSRYSTDEKWLVPHFEKMLYDNALLMRLYAQARTSLGFGAEQSTYVPRPSIADYVAREMTDPDGAFYSAQDADSREEDAPEWQHAEEGAFYVWTPEQISDALDGDGLLAQVVRDYFGVQKQGNFEGSRASVLYCNGYVRERRLEGFAERVRSPEGELAGACERLFQRRERRPKPFRDEKVLTSWNALMICGLVEGCLASLIENRERRTRLGGMAIRAYDAINNLLMHRTPDGLRVLRSAPPRDADGTRSPATIPGFLDDYAYLANAALSLYALTGLPRYAIDARAISDAAIKWFHDEKDGGFFFSPSDGEALIHRSKDAFDHAIPSAVAVLCEVLLQLHSLTGEARYEEIARATLTDLAPIALKNPLGMSQVLIAIDRLQRGSVDIVVVSKTRDAASEALRLAAGSAWERRNLVTIVMDEPETIAAAPALAIDKPAHDKPVAYVCRDHTCSAPVSDPNALYSALASGVASFQRPAT